MNKTLTAFLSESNISKDLIKKIFNNLAKKHNNKMVFNLTIIEFDFTNEQAIIYYFVEDKDYPDVELSFNELINILTKELSKGHVFHLN
jgi:hypothetical protein